MQNHDYQDKRHKQQGDAVAESGFTQAA